MAYNPYDSAKKITDLKTKWANAKAKGEDTSAFENEATAYYDDLRKNGRSDVADYLQKSDAVQASEYMKAFSPDYTSDADSLQQKSNVVFKNSNDYAEDVRKSYDKIYEKNIDIRVYRINR